MAVTNQNIFKQILEQLEGNGQMGETKGLFGGFFDLEDEVDYRGSSSKSNYEVFDQPEVDFDEQSKQVEVVDAVTKTVNCGQDVDNEDIVASTVTELIGEFDARKAIIYSEIIKPKYF